MIWPYPGASYKYLPLVPFSKVLSAVPLKPINIMGCFKEEKQWFLCPRFKGCSNITKRGSDIAFLISLPVHAYADVALCIVQNCISLLFKVLSMAFIETILFFYLHKKQQNKTKKHAHFLIVQNPCKQFVSWYDTLYWNKGYKIEHSSFSYILLILCIIKCAFYSHLYNRMDNSVKGDVNQQHQ